MTNAMTVPTMPENVAERVIHWVTDTEERMQQRVDNILEAVREGSQSDTQEMLDNPGATASLTLYIGYTSTAEAAQAVAKANDVIRYALPRLKEYGLMLVDLNEWRPVIIAVVGKERKEESIRTYPLIRYSVEVVPERIYTEAYMAPNSPIRENLEELVSQAESLQAGARRAWTAHQQVIADEGGGTFTA